MTSCTCIGGFPCVHWYVFNTNIWIQVSIHTQYMFGMYWVCIWFVFWVGYVCMYLYVWHVFVCIQMYLHVFACVLYWYVLYFYCMYWYVLHTFVCIGIDVYWRVLHVLSVSACMCSYLQDRCVLMLWYLLECIVRIGTFWPVCIEFMMSVSKYTPILSNTFQSQQYLPILRTTYQSIHDVFRQYYAVLRLDWTVLNQEMCIC